MKVRAVVLLHLLHPFWYLSFIPEQRKSGRREGLDCAPRAGKKLSCGRLLQVLWYLTVLLG